MRLRPLLRVRTQAETRVQTRFEGALVDVDPPGAAPGFTVDVEPADGGAAVRLRFEANEQTACNGRHGAGQGGQGLQMMETCLQERVTVTARVRAGQDEFLAEEVCFGGHVPGDAVDVAMGFVADWVGTSYTIVGARLTSGAGGETIGAPTVSSRCS